MSSGEAKREFYVIFEFACRRVEEQSNAFPSPKFAQSHKDVWGVLV
jgi:hypothetical protein